MEDECKSRTMGTLNVNKSKRRREPSITSTLDKSKKRRQGSAEGTALRQQNVIRTPQYMSHVEVPGRTEDAASESMTSNTSVRSPEPQEEKSITIGTNTNNTSPTSASSALQPTSAILAQETISSKVTPSSTDPMDEVLHWSRAEQAIHNELGLEILLRHNELRLIEQEIGKCQVALEQLRRCSVIPYPATTSTFQDMDAVTSGVGMAQLPQPGRQPATHPPPWGVTDGPYSRHYASWLLPDPAFDGLPINDARTQARAEKKVPERQTRGGHMDQSGLAPKPRGRRGSVTSRLQALPAGYPEAKEDKRPPTLMRASDGKQVKLVCIDCNRENFNSAQGFINHCRIAHSRNFASHEAAAQLCGREVETDEAGAPVIEPTSQTPITAGLVHPLIRGGVPVPVPTLSTPVPKRKITPASRDRPPNPDPRSQVFPQDQSPGRPFVPSSKVPHLSRLLERLQHGGDLDSLVNDATTKENLDTIVSDDEQSHAAESDHEMTDVPSPQAMSRVPSRLGLRGGPTFNSPANTGISGSHKGPNRATRHPGNLHVTQDPIPRAMPHNSATFTLLSSPPHDLSPHTVESNIAPSLVSDDDDDDDDGSQASETSEASGVGDEEQDVDVDVNLEMRGTFGEETVAGSSVDPELRASSKARTHHSARSGQVATLQEPPGTGTPAASIRTGGRNAKKAGRGRPRK